MSNTRLDLLSKTAILNIIVGKKLTSFFLRCGQQLRVENEVVSFFSIARGGSFVLLRVSFMGGKPS